MFRLSLVPSVPAPYVCHGCFSYIFRSLEHPMKRILSVPLPHRNDSRVPPQQILSLCTSRQRLPRCLSVIFLFSLSGILPVPSMDRSFLCIFLFTLDNFLFLSLFILSLSLSEPSLLHLVFFLFTENSPIPIRYCPCPNRLYPYPRTLSPYALI